jgi:hypothetical protein
MLIDNPRQMRLKALQIVSAFASAALGLSPCIVPAMAAEIAPSSEQTMTSGDLKTNADEIYLYGEVSKPDQPGKGYFIFSKTGSQVVGAIYYPHSEYSCFMGRQDNARLDVKLVESGEHASPVFEVPLNPMYAIAKIGSAEAKALSACRQEAMMVRTNPGKTASADSLRKIASKN